MATGIAPSEAEPLTPGSRSKTTKAVDFDKLIEKQLRKTRGQVKIVEISAGLMALGLAAVAFFLIAAVLDHWIIPHGLGTWGRLLFCLVFVGGTSYWLAATVLPALFGRVNPIYAAQAIEHSKPSLKNSLINFLLLRPRRERLSPYVFRALEEQAATGISNLPAETAVDRTRLIHSGYALIALVAVFALYFIVSPKNPFTSAARVILPWADLQAPSRVTIRDIQPGSTSAFCGQPVKISAELDGLSSDDEVSLIYSTADRQVVERAVRMHLPTGGYRHTATLPEGELGVQQDMEYRIEAGDARSKSFRIEATAAPLIVVDRIDYKYPAYTEIPSSTVKNRGDLKAIEGTEVTIHATANQSIKSASIDFSCDGRQDRSLTVSGQSAKITLTLAMNSDRTKAEFDCYQLRFVTPQGVENPKPVRHNIEVTPDLAPEVQILAPEQEEIEVPLNGAATFEIKARDPDFALGSVTLEASTEHGKVLSQPLLADAPHRGPFVGKYKFLPPQLKLKVGDVVHYRAIARDDKSPDANEVISTEKRIRIVASDTTGRDQQRQPDNPQPDPASENRPNDRDSEGAAQQSNPQNRDAGNRDRQNKADSQNQKQQDGSRKEQNPQSGDPQQSGDENRSRDELNNPQRDGDFPSNPTQPPSQDKQQPDNAAKNANQQPDKANGVPPNKNQSRTIPNDNQGSNPKQPNQNNKGDQDKHDQKRPMNQPPDKQNQQHQDDGQQGDNQQQKSDQNNQKQNGQQKSDPQPKNQDTADGKDPKQQPSADGKQGDKQNASDNPQQGKQAGDKQSGN
ncbi:MAG: hypothetical protein IT427_00470 [Pirellulales bacterium]|nr:hypothetical protein [Pirellulales bacterium]